MNCLRKIYVVFYNASDFHDYGLYGHFAQNNPFAIYSYHCINQLIGFPGFSERL